MLPHKKTAPIQPIPVSYTHLFVNLSLDDKDDLWNEVKAAEKPGTEKTED